MPHKLLIIEDNEDVLKTLSKFFKARKYEVIIASNGLDGLKIIETLGNEFDLIITDLIMPNISGVGIISIVKEKYPQLPVVAITGWGEHPEALAREANADIVLEKPIELVKLDQIISDLISKKAKPAK